MGSFFDVQKVHFGLVFDSFWLSLMHYPSPISSIHYPNITLQIHRTFLYNGRPRGGFPTWDNRRGRGYITSHAPVDPVGVCDSADRVMCLLLRTLLCPPAPSPKECSIDPVNSPKKASNISCTGLECSAPWVGHGVGRQSGIRSMVAE